MKANKKLTSRSKLNASGCRNPSQVASNSGKALRIAKTRVGAERNDSNLRPPPVVFSGNQRAAAITLNRKSTSVNYKCKMRASERKKLTLQIPLLFCPETHIIVDLMYSVP